MLVMKVPSHFSYLFNCSLIGCFSDQVLGSLTVIIDKLFDSCIAIICQLCSICLICFYVSDNHLLCNVQDIIWVWPYCEHFLDFVWASFFHDWRFYDVFNSHCMLLSESNRSFYPILDIILAKLDQLVELFVEVGGAFILLQLLLVAWCLLEIVEGNVRIFLPCLFVLFQSMSQQGVQSGFLLLPFTSRIFTFAAFSSWWYRLSKHIVDSICGSKHARSTRFPFKLKGGFFTRIWYPCSFSGNHRLFRSLDHIV